MLHALATWTSVEFCGCAENLLLLLVLKSDIPFNLELHVHVLRVRSRPKSLSFLLEVRVWCIKYKRSCAMRKVCLIFDLHQLWLLKSFNPGLIDLLKRLLVITNSSYFHKFTLIQLTRANHYSMSWTTVVTTLFI